MAVLDHGMGNLRSVARALEASGARVVVTSDPSAILPADKLCVPGQGIFGRCMAALDGRLGELVLRWIADERPYLGICLGMQVLFGSSEEGGGVQGLGVLEGEVRRLPDGVTVPHIGWNEVGGEHYYFDHSYAAYPRDPGIVTGWCEHGETFAATIETGPILGVQFHPEKSAGAGLTLLERWSSG